MFKSIKKCVFLKLKHLDISIFRLAFPPLFQLLVTSCPKLSGLEEQPNILLLMICGSDIWAGLSGDSFSLFCKVLAEAVTLGLEKSRWLQLPVWGLGTGYWLGNLSSPCGFSIGSVIIYQTTLSYSYRHWDCSRKVKTEIARYLKALTWKSYSDIPMAKPSHTTHPESGRGENSILWWKNGLFPLHSGIRWEVLSQPFLETLHYSQPSEHNKSHLFHPQNTLPTPTSFLLLWHQLKVQDLII